MDTSKDTLTHMKQMTTDFETELANISGGYIPIDPTSSAHATATNTDAGVDALNGLL